MDELYLAGKRLEDELAELFANNGWNVDRNYRDSRNAPFDFLLYDGEKRVGAVEVKMNYNPVRLNHLSDKLRDCSASLDLEFVLLCIGQTPYMCLRDGNLEELEHFPTPENYREVISGKSPVSGFPERDDPKLTLERILEQTQFVYEKTQQERELQEKLERASNELEKAKRKLADLRASLDDMLELDSNDYLLDGKNALIFLASGWGFTKGGINSYNTQLVKGLAKLKVAGLEVFCFAPGVSQHEIDEAAEEGFRLVHIPTLGCKDGTSGYSADFADLVVKDMEALGYQSYKTIIWVGHDVYTGDVALQCKANSGVGKCAVFHHMAYDDYYPLVNKDHVRAREKEHAQARLMKKADYVFANGPVLAESARDLKADNKDAVFEVLSGLSDIVPAESMPESGFKVIYFGRVESKSCGSKVNNSAIKQAYLAFAAWASWLEEIRGHGINPNSRFKIFGCGKDDQEEVLERLTEFFKKHCSSVNTFEVIPYEEDREVLLEDLKGFSMCMMLSTREGFGMAALEAISAGVPVVVSEESGFYKALESRGLADYVHHFSVKGSHDEPYYHDEDLKNASDAVWQVFCMKESEKKKVLELRKKL